MERLGQGTLLEIRKEAAGWLIEMDLEPKDWDRRGFAAWLKSSPRHMQEFLEQTALWVKLHDMAPGQVDVHHVLQEAGSVVTLPQSSRAAQSVRSSGATGRNRWRLGACAAFVLAILVGAFWMWHFTGIRTLTTSIGEQRAVKLPDRSVVYLNTNSRAEVHFSDQVRGIRLLQGEALFAVERDPKRPFRVYANGVQVEAIGTQFNVRRSSSETVVAVVEGRVAITTVGRSNDVPAQAKALAAGEQARVAVDGRLEQQVIDDIAIATAWRRRQLVFHQTPFSEVAEEVGRYNASPRLQFEGEVLRARRLDGVFAADEPETLIQFLAQDPELSVIRRGDTVLIRPR